MMVGSGVLVLVAASVLVGCGPADKTSCTAKRDGVKLHASLQPTAGVDMARSNLDCERWVREATSPTPVASSAKALPFADDGSDHG